MYFLFTNNGHIFHPAMLPEGTNGNLGVQNPSKSVVHTCEEMELQSRERTMHRFIAYVSLKCGRGLLGFRPPSCNGGPGFLCLGGLIAYWVSWAKKKKFGPWLIYVGHYILNRFIIGIIHPSILGILRIDQVWKFQVRGLFASIRVMGPGKDLRWLERVGFVRIFQQQPGVN